MHLKLFSLHSKNETHTHGVCIFNSIIEKKTLKYYNKIEII
jgi:hypothetical protein